MIDAAYHPALEQIRPPAAKRLAVRVTPAAEKAVRSGHPWLFDRGVSAVSENSRSGDLAVVFDRKKRFLAIGLYDPDSPIRVRILHHGKPAQIGAAWFRQQVETAVQRRDVLFNEQTTGYRLVYGANDGLEGLVVDRYDQTVVLKLYTAAWLPHLRHVLPALVTAVSPERVVLRLSRTAAADELLCGLENGSVLYGAPLVGPVLFRENGLAFTADVVKGQKTGFFLDQRENRARVESLAAGRSVLNVFAYTGGFSLYAARGGAREVVSLDQSEPALAMAVQNFELNGGNTAVSAALNAGVSAAKHELIAGDAFQELTKLAEVGRLFDMVIIDPPSFAHSQAQVERALRAYARLVRLGLRVLRHGGILVMASCSSRVTAEMFFELVHETALEVKRPLIEIERTGHAPDHPITFKEAAYLKCLFAEAP
ncbi:MAG: class I SAM-dependent methyltransferase [Anaerolineales bacterium]|nr:class I SAM-dependent methyltransferase [Anaerolineales bacterium]